MRLSYLVVSMLSVGLSLAQVTLPEGTKLRVRLEQVVSSASAEEGQPVELTIADEVALNGTVLIKEGARVTGTITQAVGKRRMGRPGKLDFSIDRVAAADGQWVPIRYSLRKKSGDSHTIRTGIITAGVAVAFWPAAPAVLLLKGKDITINKGVTFDVFTDSSHVLASTSPAPVRIQKVQAAPEPVRQVEPVVQASPALASVTVTSPTGGADIEVDGHFVGNTPTTIRLGAGKHQVLVKSGALSWQRTVQVNAGSTISLNAQLAPAAIAAKGGR